MVLPIRMLVGAGHAGPCFAFGVESGSMDCFPYSGRALAQFLLLYADVADLTISTTHCDADTHACCLQALQLLHDCVGNGAPSSNWGDGFASQAAVLALFPTCDISNPGPVFFEPLLTRPYLSQVTIPFFLMHGFHRLCSLVHIISCPHLCTHM